MRRSASRRSVARRILSTWFPFLAEHRIPGTDIYGAPGPQDDGWNSPGRNISEYVALANSGAGWLNLMTTSYAVSPTLRPRKIAWKRTQRWGPQGDKDHLFNQTECEQLLLTRAFPRLDYLVPRLTKLGLINRSYVYGPSLPGQGSLA